MAGQKLLGRKKTRCLAKYKTTRNELRKTFENGLILHWGSRHARGSCGGSSDTGPDDSGSFYNSILNLFCCWLPIWCLADGFLPGFGPLFFGKSLEF